MPKSLHSPIVADPTHYGERRLQSHCVRYLLYCHPYVSIPCCPSQQNKQVTSLTNSCWSYTLRWTLTSVPLCLVPPLLLPVHPCTLARVNKMNKLLHSPTVADPTHYGECWLQSHCVWYLLYCHPYVSIPWCPSRQNKQVASLTNSCWSYTLWWMLTPEPLCLVPPLLLPVCLHTLVPEKLVHLLRQQSQAKSIKYSYLTCLVLLTSRFT